MGKALKTKEKETGARGLSRMPGRLDTLACVRTEMARLYRLWTRGELPSDEMTKGIYALKEMRGCIESALLEDVQERLTALGLKVEARRGH